MLRRVGGLFSVRVLGAALQAVVLLYLARKLGPIGFGAFAAVIAVGGVVANVLSFGSRVQSLRIRAATNPAARASTLTFMRLSTAIICGALTVVVGGFVFDLPLLLAVMAATYVLADALSIFAQNLLLGLQDHPRTNVVIFSKPLLPGVGIAIGEATSFDVIVTFSIGLVLAAIIALAMVLPHCGQFESVRDVFVEARPYWASTTLASLQQLDVTIVAAVASPNLAGNFAGAQRLVNPLNLAVTSVLSIVTPELSRTSTADVRRQVFGTAMRAVLVISIGFLALAPVLAFLGPKLLGPEYRNAAPLFAALSVALGFNAVAQVYASSFYSRGQAHILSGIRLFIAPFSLFLVLLAASLWSEWGLGAAVIAGRAVECLILHRYHSRFSA